MKRRLVVLLALISTSVGAGGPYRFHAVTPCRLLDTRTVTPIATNTQRSLAVRGNCGVPADAQAVAVNVTVLSPASTGHLVVFTTGAIPALPALLFSGGEAAVANGSIVELSSSAEPLSLLPFLSAGGAVHVLVDVTGYFKP